MHSNESYVVWPIKEGLVIPESTFDLGGRPPKYPWMQLEVSVGDPLRGPSFLVTCPTAERKRLWSTLGSSAKSVERRTGYKFTLRSDKKGIRVWRIK